MSKNKLGFNLLFLLLFLGLAYLFGYFNVINEPADGVHVWRQTDCLSIAYKYYSNNNSLFEPQMHNQLGNKGKAAGEFPLPYYIVAQLYHLFGVHNWVYRGFWWLIALIGYYFLYKFCAEFLKDRLWGLLVSAFTFASPIAIIYGISFIPDSFVLSPLFASWFFIYRYYKNKKTADLLIATCLITLIGLIKISALIPIIAVILIYIRSVLKQTIHSPSFLKKTFFRLIPLTVSFLLISCWYIYADYYSQSNNTSYFSSFHMVEKAAIWKAENVTFNTIFFPLSVWSKEYFYDSGRHVLYFFSLFIILPFFYNKLNRSYYWIYFISMLGFFAFYFIFYNQFINHDYYLLSLLYAIPFTVIFFIKKYQFLLKKNKYYTYSFQLLFSILLIASIIHGRKKANERFDNKSDWLDKNFYELNKRLSDYGIKKDDLVLVPHDPSSNISLYAMNRNGWTQISYLQSKESINEKVQQGAKWMIVSNKTYYKNKDIDSFMKNEIAEFNGIRIYSLQAN